MTQDQDLNNLDTTDEMIAERRAGAPGETPEDMNPLSRLIVGNICLLYTSPSPRDA